MEMKMRLTKRLLIAGLLAVPMTLTTGDGLAQSCKSGGCGGPSNVEVVMKDVKSAAPTVASGDLQSAYDRVEAIADKAEKLKVDGTSKVRNGMRELAGKLDDRAGEELEAAIASYFEGYTEDALAKFEELAGFKGIPTAKKAQRELDKEEDRAAWREASELATKHISDGEYLLARGPLNDMQRLARRTDYTKHNTAAMQGFSEDLLAVVESAEGMIAAEQYETSYATLIEISRLIHARQSASAARKVLGKHANLEGMRMAKGEYKATQELAQAKSWFAEIASPSNKEQQLFKQKLEAITKTYSGTTAAEQAQQLLLNDAQAAR